MRLTLGFSAVLLACAATAHAQGTSVGVKAGFNLADLSIPEATSTIKASNLTGLVAGVFAICAGGQHGRLPARGALQYAGREVHAGRRDREDHAVLIGPSIGFRTRARIVAAGQPDVDLKDQLDGRYTWGLKNIVKGDTSSSPDVAKNRVFSATVGLRF